MPYARDFEDSSTIACFSIKEHETSPGVRRDHWHFALYTHRHRWSRNRRRYLYEVGNPKRP